MPSPFQADYIIVGAGSAGCVLASRLSENPSCRVLLIEAGAARQPLNVRIPAAYSKLHHSKHNWNFFTVPQKHVNNRKMYQPRGKLLGGSSAVNCMAYIRGNVSDFDDWEAQGNVGWSYADMLPYFRKSENNHQIENDYHGVNGPLSVSYSRFETPLTKAFIEANEEVGIPYNPDFNGERQEGAGKFQFTIRRGIRNSAFEAYIRPWQHRPNLRILSGVHATGLLWKGDRIAGIHVSGTRSRGNRDLIEAPRVILSGGAFQSPQLLMLSGIGHPDYLKEKGIDGRVPLSGVGKNLSDHLFVNLSVLCNQRISYNHAEQFPWVIPNLLRYLFALKGPLSSSPLAACSFLKTDPDAAGPDLQFHFAPASGSDLHDKTKLDKEDGFTILPTLLKPRSRGYVGLHSADPFDPPLIDPCYLSDPQGKDLETLLKGVKWAEALLLSTAFAPFRKSNSLNFPGAFTDDNQRKRHILETCETVYHPCGTCRMGLDSEAVVSPKNLQVHGLEGLHVVDASVFPEVTSGNTNAPVIAVAEKAADLIRYCS